MAITMLELRQLIADNCDLSQPLHVVAHDVGKKAPKHSVVRVDEDHPVRLVVSPGLYDKRASIEFAYDAEATVLMPQEALDALDELLEEHPNATLGWVYFFYFPFKYRFLFGRVKEVENSLMDTNLVLDIYMADDEPNTLVIKAPYSLGQFDV